MTTASDLLDRESLRCRQVAQMTSDPNFDGATVGNTPPLQHPHEIYCIQAVDLTTGQLTAQLQRSIFQ